MNGVSHMLPFVVGGGILIALAFLIDGFSVDLNSLPLDQRSNFGTITPMAAMFKSIGGVAFGFMLPILAGFIAMSIADRPGLAVGFVGGAIAANGTSGFLGALVAGFLAGYVVVLLKKICSKLPDSLEGTKPVLIYPLFGIFIVGVLLIVGMNKVVKSEEDALHRARNEAAPINAQRFGIDTPCSKNGSCFDCKSPQCICCQILTTRFSRVKGRFQIILVDENLGF